MNFLVTGANGLLGSRIGARLLDLGHRVRLSTRHPSLECHHSNSEVVITKWTDRDCLSRITQGIDVVVHCAGMASGECAANPKSAVEFNGHATKRLVEASCMNAVKKFIYLSTVHVYSENLSGTFDETMTTKNQHPYAKSKLIAEEFVLYNNLEHQMQRIVLRVSNCVGFSKFAPTRGWNLVANDLIKQAMERKEINITGNFNAMRDFIPLSYLTEAVYYFSKKSTLSRHESIFNISSGNAISLLSLATQIQKLLYHNLNKVLPVNMQEDLAKIPTKLHISNHKLMALGFSSDTKLRNEITNILKYRKNC
jgi:UDP-glucose 4-epimerase